MRFLLLLPFFLSLGLSGQDLELKSELDKPFYLSPRIGFNLSGLINPYNHAAAVTGEFPLSYNWRLEGELGYIFGSSNRANFKGESHSGFRLRTAVKYYLGYGFYTRLVFKYHRTNTLAFYNLLSPGADYEEWFLTELTINTTGGLLALGYDIELTENNRWILDISGGLGVVNFNPKNDLGIPDGFQIIDGFNDNLFVIDSQFSNVDLSISIQLEYIMRRK